jgi:type II secretory pathway pseudopilin PulG
MDLDMYLYIIKINNYRHSFILPSKLKHNQTGLVLVELIIAMIVFTMLVGLATINLLGIKQKTTLATTVTSIVSDLRNQQTKAQTGETNGTTNYNYGIRIEANRYILFKGSSYNASEPTNFTVNLEDNMYFSDITVPSASIIFQKGSGEFSGFSAGANIFSLNSQNGEKKVLSLNRYGVVVSVN